MAFEVSNTGYQQIDPTFLPGYAYEDKYHNIGQLQTPYQGKKFGQGGDYAPPQRTRYYTVDNPNYPYVLDKDFRAAQFLPTEGCCFSHPGYFPCYEDKYPNYFVPPDYFAPKINYPHGHAPPSDKIGPRMYNGSVMAFAPENHHIIRENYGSENSGVFDRRRLRVAHVGLQGSKKYWPKRA